MKSRVVLLGLFVLLLSLLLIPKLQVVAEEGDSLPPCYVTLPSNYKDSKTLSAIIVLRGAGGNAESLAGRLQDMADRLNRIVFCPEVPFSMYPNEVVKQSESIYNSAFKKIDDYKVDKANILLMGISFSSPGTAHIASTHSDNFKGVLFCSPSKCPADEDLNNDNIKKLPIYVWYGEKDMLNKSAKLIVQKLQGFGHSNVTEVEAKGVGHSIPKDKELDKISVWAETLDSEEKEGEDAPDEKK